MWSGALIAVLVGIAALLLIGLGLIAKNTGNQSDDNVAKKQKICGGCRRVMLPVWTKCLFCGWAPAALLEFILGPMANQALLADRGDHDDRLGRRQHRRARRPGCVTQARRHPEGRR